MAATASETPSQRVAWGKSLVGRITCPHCWHLFPPEDTLFVAKHPDLIGDLVLGDNEYLRFSPTRFTAKGEALDPHGIASSEMACPRCHLPISDALLEVPPLFISLIGSPASGKSYFLTTMAWQLRSLLPKAGLAFSDADPLANSALHEYEKALFLNPRPDQPTLIRKTEVDDSRLHKTATIDGVPIRFPLPFQFLSWPTPDHPNFAEAHRVGRVVVFYDNAGEDFRPGMERADSAATLHLARCSILFMLFDPTQEPRLSGLCRTQDPQLTHGLRPGAGGPSVTVRQETFLREATVRLLRFLGLSQGQRLDKPLVVIIPKFDILEGTADISLSEEPYSGGNGGGPLRLKIPEVERVSETLRGLLRQHCPEFVASAETLSEHVRYIPVSSFGGSPELIEHGDQKFYGIRPQDIKPRWVTVPLMYCLSKWSQLLLTGSAATAQRRRHSE